jgi:hypothetical protein
MDSNSFESAIKSDLAILSTLKMGYISAKDLYGSIFNLTLKLSFLLLAINTGVRLALMASGLYPITLSAPLMIGTWIVCFMTSLVFGFAVSRFILISQLIKGRLKTEGMIRETFRYLGWVCLGIYISVYAIITLLVVLGFDDHLMDPGLLAFTTLFSQAVAFIAATSITGLLSGVELDRLGLGAMFNVLSELITKARKSHQNTHSGKDAR